MDNQDFSRSRALNNIPSKKLQAAIKVIEESADELDVKAIKLTAINRYAESNIPIEYWGLRMDRDFVGDARLKQRFDEYVLDLKASYVDGTSICFAGGHGLGKTMTATCILKKACQKGYFCLYTNLSDIVSILTSGSGEDKFLARRELVLVDFLVIDEVDNRFFKKSEAANDIFASTLESIVRARLQNKMPIILATNSPQIRESFTSLYKASLGSLMSKIEFFSVMPGADFRTSK